MTELGIAGDAVPFLTGLVVLALLLFVIASWLGRWPLWLAGYGVTILILAGAFFFRDPSRTGERGPDLYLAPADGEVIAVEPVEGSGYLEGDAIRVAIYLSLFDVHVQRSPVDGVVDYVEHRPGGFSHARSDRAGANESTAIGIRTEETRVPVRQVAGTVARRIVTYVEEGEQVDQGDRIGLIRFGSRVETYLPAGTELMVRAGDRVQAGTTVIARAPAARTP